MASQLYGTDDDFHDVTIYYKSLTNHESNYGWRFGAGTDLINYIYFSFFFFYTSVTKSSVTKVLYCHLLKVYSIFVSGLWKIRD